ncbi:5,6-dimethylbenzimidazole synthase [Acidianus ambivalens]|uniref:5,6-dimethylbenzimidazole synthase n=1 Tax=Acidianus ambivalens TaxID=2283 RepID=A0A650CUV3_ACIAM|nr:5,6-dimethylbenzimidazole synthase [Acidianus ambivalens]MQL55955.1 5,6-dimethylbenzimidazole synthase [Acidianus ambivalens]QGR21485.1 5,6-dimethylbenzimidazole synthase [Acidianus ambivalens]
MDLYDAIKGRRDIRSYFKSDPILDEVLAKILLAAHLAPSVGYSQPWNFIIIRDENIKRKVKEEVERQRLRYRELLDEDRRKLFDTIKIEGIMEAPINIAVTCDPSRFGPHVLGRITMPETCNYSTVLAIENLWLAARAENLGMGWVSFLDKNKIKEILGIPSNVEFIAYLTLGYVTKFPERPELEEKGWNYRLPLSEVVFEDRWGNKPNEKLLEKLNSAKI